MTGWAVEALIASTALMLAVLLVRGPVRRWFGAELAYALWAIPALRLILPPLPQQWHESAAVPMAEIGRQASAAVLPLVQIAPVDVLAPALPETSWFDYLAPALAGAWALGAVAFLGWQTVRYVRFRLALMARAVPVARQGRVAIVESDGATGPLAFGIVRRVVAFPPDFAARYDADERELALAHELGHHARGDLIANWVALAVLSLHWFNPVAWFAYRAFRADQEMANDAGVLARLGPGARHAYGCAIVKAAHGRALTPACHLHTIKDLKGRLRMLGRKRASRARIAAGSAGAMMLAVGALGVTASGTQAAETVRDKVETATGVDIARLDPVAAIREASAAVAPAPMPAPAAGHETRVIVKERGTTRTLEGEAARDYLAAHPNPSHVVVNRDRMTMTYADGRHVTRIAPVPPVPPLAPVPPVPPMPAVPATDFMPDVPAVPEVPVVADRHCGGRGEMTVRRTEGGRTVTVICTDRIEASAKAAARASVDAQRIAAHATRDAERSRADALRHGRQAMASAMATMAQTRRELAANRSIPDEDRADALRDMDEAMAELRQEMRDIGKD